MKFEVGTIIYLPDYGLCKIHKLEGRKIEIIKKEKVGFLKYKNIPTGEYQIDIRTVWIDPIGNTTGIVHGFNYLMYDIDGWRNSMLQAIRILNQIKHL